MRNDVVTIRFSLVLSSNSASRYPSPRMVWDLQVPARVETTLVASDSYFATVPWHLLVSSLM